MSSALPRGPSVGFAAPSPPAAGRMRTGASASGRLGVVAGGGALPLAVAEGCRTSNRPVFVLRLDGFADADFDGFEQAAAPLGRFGEAIDKLKAAGCTSVCFAGQVARPDFARLAFDELGLRVAPDLIAAAAQGDDALLRATAQIFADAGFAIEGVQAVTQSLLLPAGVLGAVSPGDEIRADIVKALSIARAMGALDVGQGAVVARGLVLAVEAQEGTDAMLARVAGLPPALRGAPDGRQGVLAKAPKPMQDRRLDLPVIGPTTIEGARAAGLAGVVGEAGGVLLIDRERVIALADAHGLFVLGVAPDGG